MANPQAINHLLEQPRLTLHNGVLSLREDQPNPENKLQNMKLHQDLHQRLSFMPITLAVPLRATTLIDCRYDEFRVDDGLALHTPLMHGWSKGTLDEAHPEGSNELSRIKSTRN
jgi:hypothetical protein